MRYLGTALTVVVVLFWLVMNGLQARRQLSRQRLGFYQRGIAGYLGTELRRERWLGIWKKTDQVHRKVGYTGLVVEKVYAETGLEYVATIETVYRGEFPVPPLLRELSPTTPTLELEILGSLVLDAGAEPDRLQVDLTLTLPPPVSTKVRLRVTGRREGHRLLVEMLHGEDTILRIPLPRQALALSDGFSPAVPIGRLEVGSSFEIRVLDVLSPFGLGDDVARIRVVGQTTRDLHGVLVDVYDLETALRGKTYRSQVTASGEVVEQELGPPLNLVLRHAPSRRQARRGFDR